MNCTQCGAEIKEGKVFCTKCGTAALLAPLNPVVQKHVFCTECACEILDGESFCGECGTPVVGRGPVPSTAKPVPPVPPRPPSPAADQQASVHYMPKSSGKEKSAPNRKTGMVILTIALSVVLGLSGYFGTLKFMGGSQENDYTDSIFVSDIPTDRNGNNLIGNHMFNLQEGGFMAMQGEDVFFTNFNDGGSLYCQDRSGRITKLTDFPVANLNITGDRLIFTDLQFCSFIDETGQIVYIDAATHEEIWNAAGEDAHIQYGGALYYIVGIKRFCAGEIKAKDLEVFVLDSDQPCQSPIMAEGGRLIVVTAASDDGAVSLISDNIAPLASTAASVGGVSLTPLLFIPGGVSITHVSFNLYTQPGHVSVVDPDGNLKLYQAATPGEVIVNATAVGKMGYVETYNSAPNPNLGEVMHRITMVNLETGEVLGWMEGGNLQATQDAAFFQNGDRIYRHDPEILGAKQVNHAPADSGLYKLNPDGSVEYQSVENKDNRKTRLNMRSYFDPELGRYVTRISPEDSLPWWEAKQRAKNIFGGKTFSWDPKRKSWNWKDHKLIGEPGGDDLDRWNEVSKDIGTPPPIRGSQSLPGVILWEEEPQTPDHPEQTPDSIPGSSGDTAAPITLNGYYICEPYFEGNIYFLFWPDGTHLWAGSMYDKMSFDLAKTVLMKKNAGTAYSGTYPVSDGTYELNGNTGTLIENYPNGSSLYNITVNADGSVTIFSLENANPTSYTYYPVGEEAPPSSPSSSSQSPQQSGSQLEGSWVNKASSLETFEFIGDTATWYWNGQIRANGKYEIKNGMLIIYSTSGQYVDTLEREFAQPSDNEFSWGSWDYKRK